VSPSRFIGVAEESDLIVSIGEFMLHRVLEDARRRLDKECTMVPVASTFPRSNYSDMPSRTSS